MAVDAEVPKGARSAEIRLVGNRRGGDTAMNVGFDDVHATVRFPTGVRRSRPRRRPRPPISPTWARPPLRAARPSTSRARATR